MDDLERTEVSQNKSNRGFIMRSLARGFNYSASVRSLSNAMMSDGRIYTPDISKLLDYLVSAGYVRFTDKKINSYTAYRNDAVVQLAKEGIDLVEATIEDPGVDI